jgi:membrane protein
MGNIMEASNAAFSNFLKDECMVSGAALGFYTIFSLPPLLVLVFYVVNIFGISQDRINNVLRKQIGIPVVAASEPAEAEKGSEKASRDQASGSAISGLAERRRIDQGPIEALGPVSKVIGGLILLFSATGVFAQLQLALNRAWNVEPDPEAGGWKNFLGKRVLSLGMILVLAFLLLVSLTLSIVLEELIAVFQGEAPGPTTELLGRAANTLLTFVMATLLFVAIYRVLPDAKMRWKDLWIGALITAFLFVVGKALIGWYLSKADIGIGWGTAAASTILILVWVYYTSLIVMFGAELTQAWVSRFGGGIRPTKGAVQMVQQKEHVRE